MVCNKPYMQVGGECCLDKDGNGICDRDEQTTTVVQTSTTIAVTTTVIPTTVVQTSAATTTTLEIIVCNPPYIHYAASCCLDLNNNSICDTDDAIVDDILDRAACGDEECNENESSVSCCQDCGCAVGYSCNESNACEKISLNLPGFLFKPALNLSSLIMCGDGVCSSLDNATACCKDCGCPSGKYCSNNTCQSIYFKPGAAVPLLPVLQKGNPYLVVVLESVKIIHNGDGTGDIGELTMIARAMTNNGIEQRVKWPTYLWKEESDGETLLGGERDAVPLFAIPESDLGDYLMLTFDFGDVDSDYSPLSVPCVVKEFKGVAPGPLGFPVDIYETHVIPFATYSTLGEDIADSIYCGKNDKIVETGGIIHGPSDNWGLNETHERAYGNIIIRYSMRRVFVSTNKKVDVKLKKITVHRDGDSGSNKGEINVFTRVADRFENDAFGMDYKQTVGQNLERLGNTEYLMSDGETKEFNQVIYSTNSLGPFLYIEVDVLDRDGDCKGEDYQCIFEEVGTLSQLWLASEAELTQKQTETITIPISERRQSSVGDVTIDLEITRAPY
ncbi:MAG: hypothetical protein V1703_02745 [Candidatus Altiarchaeota archaeon]